MKDDNVYKKNDKGRYIPFGLFYAPEYLTDGIWYVRHKEHSRAITNVGYMQGLFRLGDAKTVDIPELCGMEDLCDYIMESDEWREAINAEKGYSLNDLVHVCVKKIMDKKEKKVSSRLKRL